MTLREGGRQMIINPYETEAKSIWTIHGSFGRVSGTVEVKENGCTLYGDAYTVTDTTETDTAGVAHRRGTFCNTAAIPLQIHCLLSRFLLDGGEYEVYTQYNGWQNESVGQWQPLVTGVVSSVDSVRTSMGAAPVLALWNCQAGRGVVFHLIPRYAWELRVQRICGGGEAACVSVEIGVNGQQLSLAVAPGESVDLPEILYYTFQNKTDLDCYKLHDFCHRYFPQRELPVLYNTWLCRFDKLTYENVRNQIEPAARLGCEYFVVDAGWFGKGEDWVNSRGDWSENETGALCGHMEDIADEVRKNGMHFGFWLELESASPHATIVQTHPEYYIRYGDSYFFDFENAVACAYLYTVVTGLIDRYHARLLKLDFNQDMLEDRENAAFSRYLAGYRAFIRQLRVQYPNLYLEGCASGGMRTNLSLCETVDSVWFSDNQSVREGLRIYRDTLLRMPPQMIEKWAVIRSLPGVPDYTEPAPERILSTNDATWQFTESVHLSTLKAFLLGGPLGFSCDLNAVSSATLDALAAFVADYKRERAFWQTAVCRILADTESMLILQYSDMACSRVRIVAIAGKIRQNAVCVYPQVDTAAQYLLEDRTVSGAELRTTGLRIPLSGNYTAAITMLEKCDA